tara:strand:- start:2371 stop:2790 length:420 start_codon:yes stop_codon:yes gene_type:complete
MKIIVGDKLEDLDDSFIVANVGPFVIHKGAPLAEEHFRITARVCGAAAICCVDEKMARKASVSLMKVRECNWKSEDKNSVVPESIKPKCTEIRREFGCGQHVLGVDKPKEDHVSRIKNAPRRAKPRKKKTSLFTLDSLD